MGSDRYNKDYIMELEWDERLVLLLTQLRGKQSASKAQVKEMFELHNMRWPNQKETGTRCTKCIARVFAKLKTLL